MTISTKIFAIREATRARCLIIKMSGLEVAARFSPISLELYRYLYDASDIDFSVFIRIGDEVIQFMRADELSKELLNAMWSASTKESSDVDVLVMKNDRPKFDAVIDRVRKHRMEEVLRNNSALDRKTMETFANLSGASQMIVRGGITPAVADRASQSVSQMLDQLMKSEVAVGTLTRMILIDPTLYDHSAAVAMLGGIIAHRLLPKRLSAKESQIVALCGLFHDVGKQCIPNAILNKPGSFTEDEYEVMKQHTVLGFDELQQAVDNGVGLHDLILRVAVEHHERFTGKGYPYQKKGRFEEDEVNGIHQFTRIVSIADAFSALLMKRVYKPALDSDTAVRLMSERAQDDFDMMIFVPFVEGIAKSNHHYDPEMKVFCCSKELYEALAAENRLAGIVADKDRIVYRT